MREIKFRAWDKVKRKMCVVDDICFATGIAFLGDLAEDTCYQANLSEIELLQYTGLKDSFLSEEYYGDIVMDGDRSKWVIDDHNPAAVVFEDIATKERRYFWEMPQHTVIGNIFPNPELLEVK